VRAESAPQSVHSVGAVCAVAALTTAKPANARIPMRDFLGL
jgi:hypothetical protein